MDDDKPILPASKQTDMLMIAGWRLDEDRRRLEQGEESLRLEPKTTLLLGYLARHVGEPISREQLLAEVWPGVIVSDEVLTNAVNKIRRAFGDDRQNPKIIETIPKMGYRLIAEVVRVSLNDESQEQTGQFFHSRQKTGRNRYSWSQVIGGIILIGLLTGLGGYFLLTQPDQNRMVEEGTISLIGDKPSIAIMPFVNLGDDPYQDYFVDGITDDLITELAKNPKLLVIARDSTFFYKGQPLNISDLVSRLNVRYLLHGSVRRIEDSVRINAQLVDTANEALVWAERYDGSVDQIFKFQDEITGQIASALYAKVGFREQAGQKRQNVPALDAYDKFIYGRNRFYMYANRDENQTAREFYKDAIELDSNFASAYAMLAWTHVFDVMNGWSEEREKSFDKAISLAKQAVALNDEQPIAYFVTGLAYREKKEYIKAMVDTEKAIEIDPNYANGYMLLSSLLYFSGRPEEGLYRIKEAMRLHPHHPYNYSLHLGQVYFVLKRYIDSIQTLKDAVASYPSSERLHVWLAAAYAYAGKLDDANWEVDQVLTINPDFSLERIKETYPFKDDADRDHFIAGLRFAGFSH